MPWPFRRPVALLLARMVLLSTSPGSGDAGRIGMLRLTTVAFAAFTVVAYR